MNQIEIKAQQSNAVENTSGKNTLGAVRRHLQLHFTDATALLVESTPVLAVFETAVAGMSVRVSLNARLFAAGLTYFGGTGFIYARGRDLSRRIFGIHSETKEAWQHFHDSAYLGVFNLVFAPILYLASGARDLHAIMVGTATAVAFGLVNGGPMGYVVDVFRDLVDLEACNRSSYPQVLKRQRAWVKRTIFVLAVAAGIVLTWLVYLLKNR